MHFFMTCPVQPSLKECEPVGQLSLCLALRTQLPPLKCLFSPLASRGREVSDLGPLL